MRNIVISILLVIFLSACNTVPKVEYVSVVNSTDETSEYQKFNHGKSVIQLEVLYGVKDQSESINGLPTIIALDKKQFDAAVANSSATEMKKDVEYKITGLTATSAQVPDLASRYGVKSHGSKYFKKTDVSLEHYPDSELPKTLSVEFIDNTAKTVAQIVDLAKAGAGLKFDGRLELPEDNKAKLTVDVQNYLAAGKRESVNFEVEMPAVLVKYAKIKVRLSSVTLDAREKEKFSFKDPSAVWFYPACRDAKIEVSNPLTKEVISTSTVRVVDTNFFQTSALPLKGQFTANVQCGFVMTTEKKELPTSIENLTSILKGAKDAYDAIKKD